MERGRSEGQNFQLKEVQRLEVEEIRGLLVLECNETTIPRSVGIYQSTQSNIAEDLSRQQRRFEKLIFYRIHSLMYNIQDV
jgi:hypothetical protein